MATTTSLVETAPLSSDQPLFTCLSCSIAFRTAEEQRVHYRSDHHRYNMKRRVASLTPVSLEIFTQKVLERKVVATPSRRSRTVDDDTPKNKIAHEDGTAKEKDKELARIDEKISAAQSRLSHLQCLFCPHEYQSLDDNLTHMATVHSFFVPDADYLVDIMGLIEYLGEKIAVGNVCIYCNDRSREFRTLNAVRKHMIDKSHCKISYDSEDDRLEISDFYDFTSSYPETNGAAKEDAEEWEDLDEENNVENVDEVVDDDTVADGLDSADLPANQITYGRSQMELVLPSGARIAHRSTRRYHAQISRLVARESKLEDPKTGAALVRQLLADKNSALVPRKGGFGAYGSGTDVVRARNRGEAREAGRHVREFRDQKRREDFKTKVGFINNAQKHYRDPLLQ